jgi:hypothetical protein
MSRLDRAVPRTRQLMFEGAGRDRAARKRFQGAVQTDLVLSGAVAQFGRSTGMIQAPPRRS